MSNAPGTWTLRQAATIAAAEAMAALANEHRRWWRKPRSPMWFLPAAREVVARLIDDGLLTANSASEWVRRGGVS